MAVLAVATAMATPSALAAPTPVGPYTVDQTMSQQLLAKASPDECYNPLAPTTEYVAMPDSGVCPAGLIPKTNDAYVWGQTQVDNSIWFGTAPNYICLVMADMASMTGSLPPSFATKDLTCQFGDSPYLTGNKYPTQLDGASGDWRPPHIYRYDTALGKLVDKTPTSGTGLELINVTEGLRSAGSIGHIAFLAGPVIAQEKDGAAYKGVNVFAYDTQSGNLLAAKNFPQFSNVRQWLTVGHSIYVGMMGTDTGKIMRWTGCPTADTVDGILSFETVGTLPTNAGGPAEITYSPADGHIYATTWNLAMGGSKVYRSPTGHLNGGTFTAEGGDATAPYVSIWSPASYEPDMALSAGYLGGAIQAYDGYVYWGVIHVPAMNLLLHQRVRQQLGQSPTSQELLTAAVKTVRTTTLWRVKVNAGTDSAVGPVDLLYGETQLPKFDYTNPDPTLRTWAMAPTNWTPKLGHSGFGNPFNTYTWSMEQFNGKLFVGTFDWSYLLYGAARDLGPDAAGSLGLNPDMVSAIVTAFGEGAQGYFGADLARFDSADTDGQPTPAAFEDINGVGNYLNYGIRTMSTDANNLYIGSANPANLNAKGGWELIQLTKGTAPAFTASTPPNGRVGDAYSYTYTATGDPAAKFSLESGALPPGVTLTDAGVLSGTPTAAGDYTFRVAARNGVAPAAVVNRTITVAPAYVPPPPPYIPPVVPPVVPASPSPSVTPVSPTPTSTQAGGLACTTPTALRVLDPTIVAGRAARVQLKGTPGDKVQILGYSRPSTQYRVLRPSVTIPANGVVDYAFFPSTNTRIYAASATCTNSGSAVINVAPRFSALNAVRVGPMHYRFSGLLAPAAPNAGRTVRLVSPGYGALPSSALSVVRVGGSTLRPGSFSFDLTLTKPGRFTFLVTTAGNMVNVAGSSAGRLTSIR